MNELIDQFCESKKRWLIVTAVTGLFALALLVPLADQYTALCNENDELSARLLQVQRLAADLPAFEERVVQKHTEVNRLQERTVPEEAVSVYRTKLVEFARDSGCQVRRISFGTSRSRSWYEQDGPLAASGTREKDVKPTPFALETRPVTLSIAGSMGAVKKLLARVHADDTIRHIKFFELRPIGKDQRSVQLDLELWCYALTRANA